MLALVLILTPIAFAGGLWLSAKAVPERPHGLAARVIDLLVGAAAVVVALHVYLAFRVSTIDVFDGYARGDTVAEVITDALWMAGGLLALATIIHLLAARTLTGPSD